MKITEKLLRESRACGTHIRLFKKTFPGGAVVNIRNIKKAQKAGLHLWWISQLIDPLSKAADRFWIADAKAVKIPNEEKRAAAELKNTIDCAKRLGWIK